jgi:hypothetical protein
MLEGLIRACPDALWAERMGGYPFWRLACHAVEGLASWCPAPGREPVQPEMPVPAELDAPCAEVLSREALLRYLDGARRGAYAHYAAIDGEGAPSDAALGQLRHLMFHVGHLDACMRDRGLPGSTWKGWGEEDIAP